MLPSSRLKGHDTLISSFLIMTEHSKELIRNQKVTNAIIMINKFKLVNYNLNIIRHSKNQQMSLKNPNCILTK